MKIKNYTTTISPDKTIGEIQKILSTHGAEKIMIDYEAGNPVSLSFSIKIDGRDVGFKLPCNYRGVLVVMNKSKEIPTRLCNNEHAMRVAWRIVKDWIDSQLALIQSEQAELSQIFLPYAIGASGKTLYETFKEKPHLLLTN